MAGALPVVDLHTCACLCVDAFPTTHVRLSPKRSVVESFVVNGRKKPLVKLGSSFSGKAIVLSRSSRRLRKTNRRLVVVGDLGGQYEKSFADVDAQIMSYFTYIAATTVLSQLQEMNPTQYRWFYDFVRENNPAKGVYFIRKLGKEKHELAERVMVTRLDLYSKWLKKFDHAKVYKKMSDENLNLLRERLIETVIWPADDS